MDVSNSKLIDLHELQATKRNAAGRKGHYPTLRKLKNFGWSLKAQQAASAPWSSLAFPPPRSDGAMYV